MGLMGLFRVKRGDVQSNQISAVSSCLLIKVPDTTVPQVLISDCSFESCTAAQVAGAVFIEGPNDGLSEVNVSRYAITSPKPHC